MLRAYTLEERKRLGRPGTPGLPAALQTYKGETMCLCGAEMKEVRGTFHGMSGTEHDKIIRFECGSCDRHADVIAEHVCGYPSFVRWSRA